MAVQEIACGIAYGMVQVEITLIGIDIRAGIRTRCLYLLSGFCRPYLAHGGVRHRQTRIPRHRRAARILHNLLHKPHKLLRIRDMHLVGADMYIGAFIAYLIKKLFKAHLQHLHTLGRRHSESESGVKITAVARHVDFRNHGYAPLLGVGYHIAYLVVGIEASRIAALALISRVVKTRICLALDSPCRIIGEMPVERIYLVVRHQVEFAFQSIHASEISSGVVHESSQGKRRPVPYGNVRHPAVSTGELLQGGVAPYESPGVTCPDYGASSFDLKSITFGSHIHPGIDSRIHTFKLHRRAVPLP